MKIIPIEIKTLHGHRYFKPLEHQQDFVNLTSQQSLEIRHINALKNLGVEFSVQPNKSLTWDE